MTKDKDTNVGGLSALFEKGAIVPAGVQPKEVVVYIDKLGMNILIKEPSEKQAKIIQSPLKFHETGGINHERSDMPAYKAAIVSFMLHDNDTREPLFANTKDCLAKLFDAKNDDGSLKWSRTFTERLVEYCQAVFLGQEINEDGEIVEAKN